MGDLKALGSEKLQGIEKIHRILEIAKFNEQIPTSKNENSKIEYNLTLADGNQYAIVREKAGYILKQVVSESSLDYLAPISDRKYYKSYSQALKKLNLMAREINEIFENKEGTSLFSEQKKFVLKTPKGEKKNSVTDDDVENIPAPPSPPPPPSSPSDTSAETPLPPSGDEMDVPPPSDDAIPEVPSGDEGIDEAPPVPTDDEMPDVPSETGDDEVVTFKSIQKLTGKLGQKLRQYSSEDEKMSSKDIKYVINSILSALDLSSLDDDDKEEIMGKFEGEEDTESEVMPPSEDEIESPEDSGEIGESSETWGDLGAEIAGRTKVMMATPGSFNEEKDNDHSSNIQKIADSLFMESKVEDVLMKYFKVSEKEKGFVKEVNSERNIEKMRRLKLTNREIDRLSESAEQKFKSKKFIKENTNATLVGKTNKKNLVFEIGHVQYKITPYGKIV